MKRIAVIIVSLALSLAASAQPKAVGIVVNGLGMEGVGVSYQHYLGSDAFVDAAGLFSYDMGYQMGGRGDVIFDFIVSRPTWTKVKAAFYVGAGLTGGYVGDGYFTSTERTPEEKYENLRVDCGGAMVGAILNLGLELKFKFGLQLSIDLKPVLGAHFNDHLYPMKGGDLGFKKVGFYSDGLLGIAPGIGLRYAF